MARAVATQRETADLRHVGDCLALVRLLQVVRLAKVVAHAALLLRHTVLELLHLRVALLLGLLDVGVLVHLCGGDAGLLLLLGDLGFPQRVNVPIDTATDTATTTRVGTVTAQTARNQGTTTATAAMSVYLRRGGATGARVA